MPDARLEVTDALGRRIVPIAKEAFGIGRRETNDLRLAGSEVSRDHAEIVAVDGGFVVRDKQSRYGTYVNDEPITVDRPLAHGDRIRLGRSGGAELVFLLADTGPTQDKATTTAIGDLRQIAALLDGLRALGSGRVLDDVLARAIWSSSWRADGVNRVCPAPASPPAARFPKKCFAPASPRSSPTCSTASWRTCTWGRSRSASGTCSASP